MFKKIAFYSSVFLVNTALYGGMVEKEITYKDGTTNYAGVLVYDESISEPSSGILMVPNWMGVTDASIEKAKEIASDRYVVFVADMYGREIRPANSNEAGKAAEFVRGDRALMRARAQLSLDTFLATEAPLDTAHVAAIGFCFGGGTVLELGRSGADVDAIVSFHGDLLSPTLEQDAGKTTAKVLVLHGADDPYVPQSDVQAFISAMLETDVDWQLLQYSNTVHSFTDPNANAVGQADYNPVSSERAFESMADLFGEIWGK